MVKFSLILCIHKKIEIDAFIKSLKSIKEQSLLPSEIIIIVDGLISEGLKNILFNFIRYNKTKIILKQNAANLGHGLSMRNAIKVCNHNIIIKCDADDINLRNRFKILIEEFEKDKSYELIGSYASEKIENSKYIKKVPLKNDQIYKNLNFRNAINHQTVLFKKKAILEVGNYENLLFFEDYYLWLKLRKNKKKIKNINKVLVNVSVHQKFFERRRGHEYLKYYFAFIKRVKIKKLLDLKYIYLGIILRSIIYILNYKIFTMIFKLILRSKSK